MDTSGGEGVLLIDSDTHCRYCGEGLRKEASVCRVCLKYQNRFFEFFSKLAGVGTVASAVISLCLLGLTFVQLRDASDTLKLASAAKDQAQASESAAKQATTKLSELVANAEQTTRRLGSVEAVLTQVDLATGGRKLCMSFRPPTFGDMGTGEGGAMPLYVPAKWSAQSCANQALKFGATRFRLGCVFSDHASLGVFISATDNPSIAKPDENCGW